MTNSRAVAHTVLMFTVFNDSVSWFIFLHKIVFKEFQWSFFLLVPDVLKMAFSIMDLLYNRIVLYNRIILYNRTISSFVLFIFTGVTFEVFDIIYFCIALNIQWFLSFNSKTSPEIFTLILWHFFCSIISQYQTYFHSVVKNWLV